MTLDAVVDVLYTDLYERDANLHNLAQDNRLRRTFASTDFEWER